MNLKIEVWNILRSKSDNYLDNHRSDNAWSESFFSILKKEAVHWQHFQTREEARQTIFAYIEGFYNTRRIQKRLGCLSPIEWLNQYMEELIMSVA